MFTLFLSLCHCVRVRMLCVWMPTLKANKLLISLKDSTLFSETYKLVLMLFEVSFTGEHRGNAFSNIRLGLDRLQHALNQSSLEIKWKINANYDFCCFFPASHQMTQIQSWINMQKCNVNATFLIHEMGSKQYYHLTKL